MLQEIATEGLPILNAGHPLWYRGRLVGVASHGEAYTVGWIAPPDRPVIRAMALAVLEAPDLSEAQQLAFAAYYLLPEERWAILASRPDELIAARTGLPLDLVRCRRGLPALDGESVVSATHCICA